MVPAEFTDHRRGGRRRITHFCKSLRPVGNLIKPTLCLLRYTTIGTERQRRLGQITISVTQGRFHTAYRVVRLAQRKQKLTGHEV